MDVVIIILFIVTIVAIPVIFVVLGGVDAENSIKKERARLSTLTPEQQLTETMQQLTRTMGAINEHLICPHCQTQGTVRAKSVTRTIAYTGTVGGIVKSGTKSVAVTHATQHHCDKCGTTWDV